MNSTPYDAVADWYDAFVRQEAHAGNFGMPHLLQLVGAVQDRRVCDVACGQGRAARALAHAGAGVVGVDNSRKLLGIARAEEARSPLGIEYVQEDAQSLSSIADAQFDGAVCNLGLTDIPDLRATLVAIHRILRPRGWFVFCIPHPCFEPPHAEWVDAAPGQRGRLIRAYFDEGYWRPDNVHGLRFRVGAYHRTLSTLVNTLADAGFAVQRLLEPLGDDVTIVREPGYAVVPDLLLVRCVRCESLASDSRLDRAEPVSQ